MSAINNVNYSTKKLTQYSPEDYAPNLLHLPQELLQVIMHKVTEETSPMKSAIRGVELSRVCAYTHKLTHEDAEIETLFRDEKKFQPFVELLAFKLRDTQNQDEADFCLHLLSNIFEHKDSESAQNAIKDLFDDFERDHPGVQNLLEEFRAQFKAYYAKEPRNKEDLFKIYYTIFKKSVAHILNKDYAECTGKFHHFSRFAVNAFTIISSDPSEIREFSGKILQDVINQFASKPLREISIDEYKYLASELPRWFNRIPPEILELFLRQAILLCHNKDEIEQIRDRYANPSVVLIAWTKSELKGQRTVALRLVDQQIHYLCGDNFNGAIDGAYRTMHIHEQRLNNAKLLYQSALMSQSQEKSVPPNGQILIDELFEAYKKKLENYEKKCSEFEQLKAQLSKYAVWTNGVITSGKKFELEAGLQEEKLTADARAICKKNSEFYAQLGRPIDEENKDELYNQLHNII